MSIAVRDLVHVYHPGSPLQTRALDGVTFEAEKGSWVAVVGHTGSGKSTLAQHLNGLLLPTEGSVSVDGIPVRHGEECLRQVRQKVGMTSSPHGPYRWGYTRHTMDGTKGRQPARGSQSHKAIRSPDRSLQLDCVKSESLVIADQNVAVNTFPGLVHTARHTMGVGFARSR